MAVYDFPDAPTNGQVYDKWTWDGTMWKLTAGTGGGGGSGFTFSQDAVPTAFAIGNTWYQTSTGDSFVWTNDGNSTQWVQFAPGSGGGGGSGFTFVQDTAPTPSKVGDTWFDSSLGATGGTSWVAIEEGAAGSEKVWVQFAPGSGALVSEWVVFVPTWMNFTPGNGTSSFVKKYEGKSLFIRGVFTLGSTSVMGTGPEMYLPDGAIVMPGSGGYPPCGQFYATGAEMFAGSCRASESTNSIRLSHFKLSPSFNQINLFSPTSSSPHTWASGNTMRIDAMVPIQ